MGKKVIDRSPERGKNRKRVIVPYLLTILIFLTSFNNDKEVSISKVEANKAFILLNDIRANPGNYYKALGFDKNLKTTKRRLVWNDTLARVAEAKARDMAERDYFAHVNPEGIGINYLISKSGYKLNSEWTKNKSDNYFESLAAGSADGEDAIKQLIIDEDDASGGYRHRIHLLGLDEWSSSLTDIGIGFASVESGSEYPTYISVIIAKHDW